MNITVIGLSITSSWGNGHATTYRSLLRALASRGHVVTFLERDVPWYAGSRDLAQPDFCTTYLYTSVDDLRSAHRNDIAEADLVIVGSYVPEGVRVLDLVLELAQGTVAFYDIDTPVTVAAVERCSCEYLLERQIPKVDLYLSFTGGPLLARLEKQFGARQAVPLYCSVDADLYAPQPVPVTWDIGYLGTYSDDRQPTLERLLIDPAIAVPESRFVVAGPQYPTEIQWPANVERIEHLPPARHPSFYSAQRFTLNVTRADMIRCGWSPSVRLFEAAACGAPIISDDWAGLDELFEPGDEILIAKESSDVIRYLRDLDEGARKRIGLAARDRILRSHTSIHRAAELEQYSIQVPSTLARVATS